MFGFRKNATDTKSLNLGFGYSSEPSIKVLGDEFVANKPAPVDKTSAPLPLRFQQHDKGGLVFITSFPGNPRLNPDGQDESPVGSRGEGSGIQ